MNRANDFNVIENMFCKKIIRQRKLNINNPVFLKLKKKKSNKKNLTLS